MIRSCCWMAVWILWGTGGAWGQTIGVSGDSTAPANPGVNSTSTAAAGLRGETHQADRPSGSQDKGVVPASDYASGKGGTWRYPTDASFTGGVFATPLPPGPQQLSLPGGPLAAPVVLPTATPQGQPLGQQFVMDVPGGRGSPFDPGVYPAPEQFMFADLSGPRRPWVWADVELLLGATSGVDVPPLITSGPVAAGSLAGAIGAPTTTFVFGERKMLDNWRPGLRAELGLWFGEKHRWGLVGRYYSLYSTSDPLTVLGDGTNVVVVPQLVDTSVPSFDTLSALFPLLFQAAAFPGTNLITGATNVQLPLFVSFPGVAVGSAAASVRTSFVGGDAQLRRVWISTDDIRWETFIGYRQLRLGDELRLNYVTTSVQTGFTATGEDNVRTSNNFYGAQLGSLLSLAEGPWSLQLSGAVALGNNACDTDFSRIRLLSFAGVTLPLVFSDSGNRINYFSVVSEANARVGVRVSRHVKFTFGYTGLYWWNVQRAQNQYNLSQNLTGRTTQVYVSMLNWGIEARY